MAWLPNGTGWKSSADPYTNAAGGEVLVTVIGGAADQDAAGRCLHPPSFPNCIVAAPTITDAEIALAARVITDAADAIPEPYAVQITRLRAVAVDQIAMYSPGASVESANTAVVRYCAYVLDTPTSWSGQQFSNAWTNSGAQLAVAGDHDIAVAMI